MPLDKCSRYLMSLIFSPFEYLEIKLKLKKKNKKPEKQCLHRKFTITRNKTVSFPSKFDCSTKDTVMI